MDNILRGYCGRVRPSTAAPPASAAAAAAAVRENRPRI